MNLPPYHNFPEISTNRIILRQITSEDLKDILEISYYDAVPAKNAAQAAEMQGKINQDYLDGNSIHWGIEDSETNKIVGTVGYYRGFKNKSGELGCVLLPKFQGKGYMIAAMQLAIDFGLKNMELKKIWSATSKDNFPAIKLLERLNFHKTADLPHNEIEFEYKKPLLTNEIF